MGLFFIESKRKWVLRILNRKETVTIKQRVHRWFESSVAWLTGLGLLALWEVTARLGMLPRFIIPAPSAVLAAIWQDAPNLWRNSRVTLIQAFIACCYPAMGNPPPSGQRNSKTPTCKPIS